MYTRRTCKDMITPDDKGLYLDPDKLSFIKEVIKTSGQIVPRGTYDIISKKDLETMRYEIT